MPPATNNKERKDIDVEMDRDENEWVDEDSAEDEDEHLEDADGADYDDEDESLARLSDQYRRFSNARRASEDHEDNQDDDGEGEEEEEEEEDDDEDDDDENEDEDDIDGHDDDEGENPLENALQALANAHARRNGGGAGPAAAEGQRLNHTFAENMARMFPEAMGLLGGFGGGTRISGLIEGLSRRDDPYLVLETLNELSEKFLMMNGLLAERSLPATQLSISLVSILNETAFQDELELQLVACRCLYNFLEINPDYVHNAINAGAIEALQSKLFEISYIDLAEQALQTLEYISRFSGTQIFRKNCLGAVLQYLDFFTIHAQRKALTIVANSVKYVKISEIHLLEEILPTLQRIVVEFTDPQELENAWLAISRIIKNFTNTKQLEKVATPALLNKMIQVISNSDTTLSTNLKLISSLSICAQNNTLSTEIIKSGHLAESIISALGKYKKTNDSGVSIDALMAAPKDLIVSILALIIYILPSENSPILTHKSQTKRSYAGIMDEYKQFSNDVFVLLINIYSSTVLFDIRRRVSICLVRIVSSLDDIKDLKDHLLIINLLASIVIQNKSVIRSEKKSSKPYITLLGSLILTHTLIEKNPEIFIKEFEREGLLTDTSSLLEILRQEDMKFDEDENMGDASDDDNENSEDNDNEEDDENEDGDEDENVLEDEHDEDEESDENDEGSYGDDNEYGEDIGTGYVGNTQAFFRDLDIPQLVKHLTKLASQIEQVYLSQKASGDSKLEHLRLLSEICGDLSDHTMTQSFTSEEWTQLWENFLRALAQEKSVISSFELISSGVLDLLLNLFNKPEYGSFDSPARIAFTRVFHGTAFNTLVDKLQESLTRSESYEILGCGLKSAGDNRAASLAKQLKVKLTNVEKDKNIENNDGSGRPLFDGMTPLVVLVHAVASLTNISTFLKRRFENPLLFGARRGAGPPPRIGSVEFLINGEVIPQDTTVYGALYKNCQTKNANFDTTKFWSEIHEIEYRKVDTIEQPTEIDERYPDVSGDELNNDPTTVKILNLLKVLYDFRANINTDSLFINYKLTAKLNRQLEEPLIVASGILPTWSIYITRKFPFLFPLETRIFFLQSTSFGYSRLIQLWNTRVSQDNENSNNDDSQSNGVLSLGRATRHKARVGRANLLKNAIKVMEKLGAHPSILEIEFVDEVGTGLGPTLEFYSSVCHAFTENKLGLWRDDSGLTDGYVHSEAGLFPAPIKPGDPQSAQKYSLFKNLGKIVARALLDSRILDFHINPLFFQACAAEIESVEYDVGIESLESLDNKLYKSLKYLLDNPQIVADMGITFVLPGYNIELIEGGSATAVDDSNVKEYVERVVDFTLKSGIKEQIENFVVGFSEVFPYYSMLVFSPHELVKLFGNADEDWSYETLLSSIHADHGYNIDSPSVQNLLRVMASFDLDERREFLKFMTGSPRLPIGGFKNLKPDFTVVLKHEEDGLKPDDYLPSVMTCANYLKLPNYTSLEVLRERLVKAMRDGADVFMLS